MAFLTEAYGEAAGGGMWDGVDTSEHAGPDGAAGARYGGQDPGDVRLAAVLVLGSLAALWLLGGVVFRSVNR